MASSSSSSSPPSSLFVRGRFIHAAASGDVEYLKKIKEEIGDDEEFRKRCDKETDDAGLGVLHYAAKNGLIDMCTFLIKEVGVDIDAKTFNGNTPLLFALKKNHPDCAKYLIESGADIAITDCRGYTALHVAVKHEDLEIMELLLTKGADIAAESVSGSPVHYAAKRGKIQSLRFLIKNNAEVNSFCRRNGFTPLIRAIISRSAECVDELLNAGAKPDEQVFTLSPLAYAVINKTNCINSLLDKGANVNALTTYGWRAVEHAARANNHEAVARLFPLTRIIRTYPEWSIDYIMKDIHSESYREYIYELRKWKWGGVRIVCNEKFRNKDCEYAVQWYSELIYENPKDVSLWALRSICWTEMGEKFLALADAKECVKLGPDSAAYHFRVGCAWDVLGRDNMAMKAFAKAIDLDPRWQEIQEAYSMSFCKTKSGGNT